RHQGGGGAEARGVAGRGGEGAAARVEQHAHELRAVHDHEVEPAVPVQVAGSQRVGHEAGIEVDTASKCPAPRVEQHAHRVFVGVRDDDVHETVPVRVDRDGVNGRHGRARARPGVEGAVALVEQHLRGDVVGDDEVCVTVAVQIPGRDRADTGREPPAVDALAEDTVT